LVSPARDPDALRLRLDATLTRALERQDDAAALRGQGRQAARRADEVRERTNLLLEAAKALVAEIMLRRGFALARPVAAAFHTNARGSTGIDVTVTLRNPAEAPAADAAIHEHLGADVDGVDVITVV
jgi:hypothetical protein